MEITILFPVLNERLRLRRGIETTVRYMRKNCRIPFRLMILDNGSTDETPEIAGELCEEYGEVSYVRIEERGVGVAFRKGVELNESGIVGYMDIDLSTNLKHLREVLRLFEACPDVDYINGSRFSRQSHTKGRRWYRRLTSRGLVLLLKGVLNMRADDAVCGFTFIRKETADRLVKVSGDDKGWFYTIEMLLRAERMGIRIVNMPVEWQEDYNTTVHIGSTVKNYLAQIGRLRKEFRKEDKEHAEKN